MGKKHVIAKSEEETKEGKEAKKVNEEIKETKNPIAQTIAPAKRITEGRVYINSSYNNTIITLTDSQGNVLGWVSSGAIGFKGTKKATPFAASKVAEAVSQIAQKVGVGKISVFVKGIGSGRESAIRSFAARGLEIVAIKDITPIPHNGCRPPKTRRV
ncbi:MAG: 30S ribosomal protein S11 [Candidatus Pacebacteria bacterium]|nr:30S ribosomal protein S11 [Candidatus Paceibacterota bacterium]